MKLEKVQPFNFKLVQELFLKEDAFLSDIFSKIDLPTPHNLEEDEDDVSNANEAKPSQGKKNRAKTFEELHMRLNEMKGQKKLGYKQKLLKKGLKNRIQKKTKKEERVLQKKLARTEKLASSGSKVYYEDASQDSTNSYQQNPIFNSQGNMVFSKFDFSEAESKKKSSGDKRLKETLKRIEEKNKKLQELEELGAKEKVVELKDKEKWKSAIARSDGEKVKDDPTLLKKSIKKEEQKKKYSAKKWDARKEKLQKTMNEKQSKRQDNILKRKKEKKNNKFKKASRRGRVIPGF